MLPQDCTDLGGTRQPYFSDACDRGAHGGEEAAREIARSPGWTPRSSCPRTRVPPVSGRSPPAADFGVIDLVKPDWSSLVAKDISTGSTADRKSLGRIFRLTDLVLLQQIQNAWTARPKRVPHAFAPSINRLVAFQPSRGGEHIGNRHGPAIIGKIHNRPRTLSPSECGVDQSRLGRRPWGVGIRRAQLSAGISSRRVT